jgi:hypothetical protein
LWNSGNIISESGVVDLVNEDPEKGGRFGTRVGLKLGVDVDDKRGGNS